MNMNVTDQPLHRTTMTDSHLDWLVDDGKGHLVTAPSTSPENRYRTNGQQGAITVGATMDLALIRDLFSKTQEARARGYKPDGTLFRYLLKSSGLPVSHILHSGQSQFTDMVGGKPLGLTIAWINRRGLDLDPSVSPPDLVLPGLQPLCALLSNPRRRRQDVVDLPEMVLR